jgi:tetratricopeptide (TPR) repeat protein
MHDDQATVVDRLLPALRALHEAEATAPALRLLEVIQRLLDGQATVGMARALMAIADDLDPEPMGAPLACLDIARSMLLSLERPTVVAACDLLAAEVLAVAGDREEAERWYRSGLETVDLDRDRVLAGRAWLHLGIVLRRDGRPAEALEAFEQALEVLRGTWLAAPVADCHAEVAQTLHEMGRGADALEPLAAARALYAEFDEPALVAGVDDRRGHVLCDLGRYEEAVTAHSAAESRYAGLGEEWEAARSARFRAHPLDHLGRRDEALDVLAGVRDTFTRLHDDLEAARCDAASAAALLGEGLEAAARPLLQSARAALAEHGCEGEALWCADLLEDPSRLTHEHPEPSRDRD